ncbi:50S ribosomal protein L17 [Flavobacteriaceae bacterium]|nr:50S ribosomal protein L17 [Flavobacteriaceae bacterium]
MIHRSRRRKLGRNSANRKALLLNLTRSLIEHEQIKTTISKAKEVRGFAEKIITISKVDNFNNRRKLASCFSEFSILNKLFKDIGPRINNRNGGYLRIYRYGFRNGDKADMALIEFVDKKIAVTKDKKFEKKDPARKIIKDEKKSSIKKDVTLKRS